MPKSYCLKRVLETSLLLNFCSSDRIICFLAMPLSNKITVAQTSEPWPSFSVHKLRTYSLHLSLLKAFVYIDLTEQSSSFIYSSIFRLLPSQRCDSSDLNPPLTNEPLYHRGAIQNTPALYFQDPSTFTNIDSCRAFKQSYFRLVPQSDSPQLDRRAHHRRHCLRNYINSTTASLFNGKPLINSRTGISYSYPSCRVL
jgi:hypothetical protein